MARLEALPVVCMLSAIHTTVLERNGERISFDTRENGMRESTNSGDTADSHASERDGGHTLAWVRAWAHCGPDERCGSGTPAWLHRRSTRRERPPPGTSVDASTRLEALPLAGLQRLDIGMSGVVRSAPPPLPCGIER